MSYSPPDQAVPSNARLAGLKRRIMQRALGMAFAGVWIALPLLPLSAVALSWLRGL